MTREELQSNCAPIGRRIGEHLEKGRYTDPKLGVAGFCKNLLTRFHALWTFLSVEGVEPTNNHAERRLRPAVIWRKKYFSTRSDYGTEYVARTASWITTCRLQSKNTFVYLTQALQNSFCGIEAPALIG